MSNIISKAVDSLFPPQPVYAHCDIPCGIYDPHLAQVAAHTVIRMTTLIGESKNDSHAVARYTATKETHAELVKQEVRILWGDYFKPEHLDKYPNLHSLVWDIMKTASKTKQEIDIKTAEDLLEKVNQLTEIFWETKDMGHVSFKAPYPTDKETVYPTSKKD